MKIQTTSQKIAFIAIVTAGGLFASVPYFALQGKADSMTGNVGSAVAQALGSTEASGTIPQKTKPLPTSTPKAKPAATGKTVSELVAPGGYCTSSQHGEYGTAANGYTYKCSLYPSGQWHWKRVA